MLKMHYLPQSIGPPTVVQEAKVAYGIVFTSTLTVLATVSVTKISAIQHNIRGPRPRACSRSDSSLPCSTDAAVDRGRSDGRRHR